MTQSPSHEFSKVTIRTTARLHLGFIDLHGGLGRIYGSLGVAISQPECVVEIERKGKKLCVSGKAQVRVQKIAEQVIKAWNCSTGLQVTTRKTIPEHMGLGSGTQLSLAIGTGITMIQGLEKSPYELGETLGRGIVSGIGTATFADGGFVIDCGKVTPLKDKIDSKIPPILFRCDVPDDWLFVIVIPNITRGLSGIRESQAFQDLPSTNAKQAHFVSRLVLMKLLPALIQGKIEDFGSALTAIQVHVGDAFASAQGGRFASPEVAESVQVMLNAGAFGAGQSSWGPTCYGLVQGRNSANKVKRAVSEFLETRTGGTVFIATANNTGAKILAS